MKNKENRKKKLNRTMQSLWPSSKDEMINYIII